MPVSAGITASAAPGLPARLLRAQEDERRRIARELHDDISQQVALIAINVDKLRQDMAATQPDVSGQLAWMLERTQALGESVRRLSHELHSTTLDHLGLRAAVRGLCQELGARHDINVDLRGPKLTVAIPEDVAGTLFRVAQEALHNVARHSGATSAIVELIATDTDVSLMVEDRGRGFDLDAVLSSGAGVGVASMRERVVALGGRCAIVTAPSKGTRIDVTVPMARPAAGPTTPE
jgi:signal transduction histidine kinase